MELLQLLLDVLVLGCPRFAAVLLVLAAALFGFCAYVFFDPPKWAGGIALLGRAVAAAALFFWRLRSGEFRCNSGSRRSKH